MKRYIKSSISTDLSQQQIQEIADDINSEYSSSSPEWDTEDLGYQAKRYGLDLLEMIEVMDWMCICGDAKELKYAARYKLHY